MRHGTKTSLLVIGALLIGAANPTPVAAFFPWMYPAWGDPYAAYGWNAPYGYAAGYWGAYYAPAAAWGCPCMPVPVCPPCDPCGSPGGCPAGDCRVAPASETAPTPKPDPNSTPQYDSPPPASRPSRKTFTDDPDTNFEPPKTTPDPGSNLPSDRFGPRRTPSRTLPETEPAPAAGAADESDPFKDSDPDKAFGTKKPVLGEPSESVIPQRKPAETAPVENPSPAPPPEAADPQLRDKITSGPIIEKRRTAQRFHPARETSGQGLRPPITDWSARPQDAFLTWR
jgi:hypothetical protein